MTYPTPNLTDRLVLSHSRSRLKAHLPLHAQGTVCSTNDLLHVLLGVCVNQTTIEAICADLLNTPDPQTIRNYLNDQLQVHDLPKLLDCVNAALTDNLPAWLLAAPRDVAIDLHDRPYYGKLPQEQGLWVRSRAKAGTTRFHRVATAYLMHKRMRLTLGVEFVLPTHKPVDVLTSLLARLDELGVRVKRLFLDKGFAGTAVQRALKALHQPALIACPILGKKGGSGTRGLCRGRGSYRTRHAFTDEAYQKEETEVAICRVVKTAKRTGRMVRKLEWMVFILIEIELTPKEARRLYRKRFGIESSYRCAKQVRGWTTSQNMAYRFVLMGLSFVVVNIWVEVRGGEREAAGARARVKFSLKQLSGFLRRALEEVYGVVREIALDAPRL